MYQKLKYFCENVIIDFEKIPVERKVILEKITLYIQDRIDRNLAIKLMYVCTHNSRRSHFGQVAASLAGEFYNIKKLEAFSAGTEATAFNQNAIIALQEIGFEINEESQSKNPIYQVQFSEKGSTKCYSKVVSHHNNPTEDFVAIMTCSDAEQNCPFIPGATLRISTTYADPKISDGTPQQQAMYVARFKEIALETFYVFSLIK